MLAAADVYSRHVAVSAYTSDDRDIVCLYHNVLNTLLCSNHFSLTIEHNVDLHAYCWLIVSIVIVFLGIIVISIMII